MLALHNRQLGTTIPELRRNFGSLIKESIQLNLLKNSERLGPRQQRGGVEIDVLRYTLTRII